MQPANGAWQVNNLAKALHRSISAGHTGQIISAMLEEARAGQGGAGRGRAGQGRAGQGRAGQGRAGQGRAGQGRAGQVRAGQGSSRLEQGCTATVSTGNLLNRRCC